MIAIITETPAVGQAIAHVLDIAEKKGGYMQGDGYMLTWTGGCLDGAPCPESYGTDSRTVLPEVFKPAPRRIRTKNGYRIDPAAVKQLETIRMVFSRCESIIAATGPGAEGELTFRDVYHYLDCTLPFHRLWICSLTESAIRRGFQNLREGACRDNLYHAAKARRKAGLWIGISAGKALAAATGRRDLFAGRLAMPVLAMVCRRYLDAAGFRPRPYWQPVVILGKGDTLFHPEPSGEYFDKQEAESLYNRLRACSTARVECLETKSRKLQPPLLYNLADLQKEAGEVFSMDAVQTLKVAVKLYEDGLISYPLTASRHISQEVFNDVPALLRVLKEYGRAEKQPAQVVDIKGNTHPVNDRKAAECHAIVSTEKRPQKLDEQQKNIYSLIAARTLEAFAPACIRETRKADIRCDGIAFSVSRSRTLKEGWTALSGRKTPEIPGHDEAGGTLPTQQGELLPVAGCSLVQKRTKPQSLFCEGSLIEAMEACGIGTPATRAGIIGTLLEKGLIERQGKTLVPTAGGLKLYRMLGSTRIADVDAAAGWEGKLAGIEKDPGACGTLMAALLLFAGQAADEIHSLCDKRQVKTGTPYICPRCRLGKVTFYSKMAKCVYSKCNLTLFREVYGKRLTDKQLEVLFKTGRSTLVKGFKNKQGKLFDAYLSFDRNGKLHFDIRAKGKGRQKAR